MVKWTASVSGLVCAPDGFVLSASLLTYHQPYSSFPFFILINVPCSLLFHSWPTFSLPASLSPSPHPSLSSPSLLHVLMWTNPTSGKKGTFFFRNRAGWRERVMELVVKRRKSIKLNGNFKKRVVSWICIALVIHFLYHSTFKQNRCFQFQLEMTLKDFESISTDSVYLHLTRVSVAKNVTLTK